MFFRFLCLDCISGKRKCEGYWPQRSNVPTAYGKVTVTLTGARRANGTITSLLKVQHEDSEESREVTHFWFVGWKDHGVPRAADGSMNADELLGAFRAASSLACV
jgi:protein tyrosine phosphatase